MAKKNGKKENGNGKKDNGNGTPKFTELRAIGKELDIKAAGKSPEELLEIVLDAIQTKFDKGEYGDVETAEHAHLDFFNKYANVEAPTPKDKKGKKAAANGKEKKEKVVEEKKEKVAKAKAKAKDKKEEKKVAKKAKGKVSTELSEKQKAVMEFLGKNGSKTKVAFCKKFKMEPAGIGGVIGNLRRKGHNISIEEDKITLHA